MQFGWKEEEVERANTRMVQLETGLTSSGVMRQGKRVHEYGVAYWLRGEWASHAVLCTRSFLTDDPYDIPHQRGPEILRVLRQYRDPQVIIVTSAGIEAPAYETISSGGPYPHAETRRILTTRMREVAVDFDAVRGDVNHEALRIWIQGGRDVATQPNPA